MLVVNYFRGDTKLTIILLELLYAILLYCSAVLSTSVFTVFISSFCLPVCLTLTFYLFYVFLCPYQVLCRYNNYIRKHPSISSYVVHGPRAFCGTYGTALVVVSSGIRSVTVVVKCESTVPATILPHSSRCSYVRGRKAVTSVVVFSSLLEE